MIIQINPENKKVTSDMSVAYETLPDLLRAEDGTSEWIDSLDIEGWLDAKFVNVPMNGTVILVGPGEYAGQRVRILLNVESAFANPKPDFSGISLSLPLISIVTAC